MDQLISIDDNMEEIQISEFIDHMEEIVAETEEKFGLWKAGDVAGLDEFLQDQLGEDPERVDFYRTLLDDRNVKMAEKIDAWLAADTDVFVVVGAGHFSGEMGIVSLLEGKGHTVVQMRD